MIVENCYNTFVEYEKFVHWINTKYVNWRGTTRNGVAAFARWIGVPQQVMSYWLLGKLKSPPKATYIARVAEKYPDVYDALGLPRGGSMPREIRKRLDLAESEIERVFLELGITGEMPEAEIIAVEIMEKYGFKYTSTRLEPE